jgi:2-dehydro-3-deoxyphosphogluconate aldolase/(4S)-4-hydroxy-2-oxoglutarate aldolase
MLEQLLASRIVLIYRGQTPEDCAALTRVLADAGIRYFEVTMNTPNALKAIRLLRDQAGDGIHIGAGTVTKPEEVDQVQAAGATYIVSPNTNFKVIERTKQLGMFSIPGAFTPTEIMNAYEAGADIVKVFPIRNVGADYIRQLRGPIKDIPFMTTGGVTLELVRPLREAGADAVGVGIHYFGSGGNPDDPAYRQSLTEQAKKFIDAVTLPGPGGAGRP